MGVEGRTGRQTRAQQAQPTSDKSSKAIQWRKNNLFYKACWLIFIGKKKEKKRKKKPLNLDFIAYTEINSKWVTDVNIQHKAIQLLVKFVWENLEELEPGKEFLGVTLKNNP